MSTPASEPVADAAAKLRLVLDYVPCEVCLSEATKDQDILCSICARLHRQVGVRVTRRTNVIVERPEPPAAAEPVVIPPPAEAPAEPAAAESPAEPAPVEEGPPPVEVVLHTGKRGSGREGRAIEVVVEPYEPPAPAYAEVAEATVAVAAPAAAAAAVVPADAAAEPAPEAPAEDSFDEGFDLQRAPAEAAPAEAEAEDEEDAWDDDVVSFSGGDDFEFTREAPERAPEPEAARAPEPQDEPPQDDFVFRPPADDDARAEASVEPAEAEEDEVWAPVEEVPVEQEDARNPWAPPEDAAGETDFLADEAAEETRVAEEGEVAAAPPAEPAPAEPPVAEEDEEILETEIVEMEVVEDDEPSAPAPEPEREPSIGPAAAAPAEDEEEILETEIVEMEIVEDDEPAAPEARAEAPPAMAPAHAAPEAPAADPQSDLFRLRGFGDEHWRALSAQRIERLSHLSGHDAHELAQRAGIAADVLVPWVQVADLVNEVGVPIDAAVAMVAAGVLGPRGLAEMDEQTVVDRVSAFGGATLSARDVRRWKRRV